MFGVAIEYLRRREMATTAAELKRMQREIETLKKKVAQLERRSSTTRRTRKRNIQIGGLWKSTPEITEQDIAAARKELWSNLGDRTV